MSGKGGGISGGGGGGGGAAGASGASRPGRNGAATAGEDEKAGVEDGLDDATTTSALLWLLDEDLKGGEGCVEVVLMRAIAQLHDTGYCVPLC